MQYCDVISSQVEDCFRCKNSEYFLDQKMSTLKYIELATLKGAKCFFLIYFIYILLLCQTSIWHLNVCKNAPFQSKASSECCAILPVLPPQYDIRSHQVFVAKGCYSQNWGWACTDEFKTFLFQVKNKIKMQNPTGAVCLCNLPSYQKPAKLPLNQSEQSGLIRAGA